MATTEKPPRRYPLREAAVELFTEARRLGLTDEDVAAGVDYSLSWTKKMATGKFTSAGFVRRLNDLVRQRQQQVRALGPAFFPAPQADLFETPGAVATIPPSSGDSQAPTA